MKILNLSLIEIVIAIFLLVLGAIAVKIGISFDINAWFRARSKHQKDKLKILCPHTEIKLADNGGLEVQSLFHSPHGTTAWICSRCQLTTTDSNVPDKILKYYAENPKIYLKQTKKLDKLIRKVYGI